VDRDLNAEAVQALTVKVDATAPVPAAPVVAGTPGTNGWYRSPVAIALAAVDATSGVARLQWTVNGGAVQTAPGATASVAAGGGTSAVAWTATDAAGNAVAGAPVNVKVDAVAPVAKVSTSPTSIRANGKLQPVKVTASASDAGSGVASVRLERSVNEGPFVPVTLSSSTAREVIQTLAYGARYAYRVTASDNAGNALPAPVDGPAFVPTVYSEGSTRVAYAGSWLTSRTSSHLGGAARYASVAGRRATFTLTGLAWSARRWSAAGDSQP